MSTSLQRPWRWSNVRPEARGQGSRAPAPHRVRKAWGFSVGAPSGMGTTSPMKPYSLPVSSSAAAEQLVEQPRRRMALGERRLDFGHRLQEAVVCEQCLL